MPAAKRPSTAAANGLESIKRTAFQESPFTQQQTNSLHPSTAEDGQLSDTHYLGGGGNGNFDAAPLSFAEASPIDAPVVDASSAECVVPEPPPQAGTQDPIPEEAPVDLEQPPGAHQQQANEHRVCLPLESALARR